MSMKSKLSIIIALVVVVNSTLMAQTPFFEPVRSDVRPWVGSLYGADIEEWSALGDGRYGAEYLFPAKWFDREVILRLRYVEAPYRLVVNGEVVGECSNGAIQRDYNITKLSHEGLNSVELILDKESKYAIIESWSREGEPIRGAEILAPARMTVREIYTTMSSVDQGVKCDVGIVLKSYGLNDRCSRVSYSLADPDGKILFEGEEDVTLGMLGCDTLTIERVLPAMWSGENPALCRLSVKLNYAGWSVEEHERLIGLRTVECDEVGDIFISGKRVTLVASEVDRDLDDVAIKRLVTTGVNTLLLSAGVDAEQMMDRCDRLGIYVIYTAPINSSVAGEQITVGGNPSNDPAWREEYMRRVKESFVAVRHHPSLVAFALAESSANGCNLYDCYLEMKSEQRGVPIIYRDCRGEWNSDKLKLVIF